MPRDDRVSLFDFRPKGYGRSVTVPTLMVQHRRDILSGGAKDGQEIIVYGMLVFVLIVVVLQLWLLTTTMNAWLGGDDAVVWRAAAVSAAGLALNVGLLKYLGRMERRAGA